VARGDGCCRGCFVRRDGVCGVGNTVKTGKYFSSEKAYVGSSLVHLMLISLMLCVSLIQIIIIIMSWNSSVGIGTGWTARVRFPAVHDFSLLHNVQTDSRAHPVLYNGYRGLFPRG
jgi:hypothetical protein